MKNLVKKLVAGIVLPLAGLAGQVYAGNAPIDYSEFGQKPAIVTYSDSPKSRTLLLSRDEKILSARDSDSDSDFDNLSVITPAGESKTELTPEEAWKYKILASKVLGIAGEKSKSFVYALLNDLDPFRSVNLTSLVKENGKYIVTCLDEDLDKGFPTQIIYDPKERVMNFSVSRDGILYHINLNGDSKMDAELKRKYGIDAPIIRTIEAFVRRYEEEKTLIEATEKETQRKIKEMSLE